MSVAFLLPFVLFVLCSASNEALAGEVRQYTPASSSSESLLSEANEFDPSGELGVAPYAIYASRMAGVLVLAPFVFMLGFIVIVVFTTCIFVPSAHYEEGLTMGKEKSRCLGMYWCLPRHGVCSLAWRRVVGCMYLSVLFAKDQWTILLLLVGLLENVTDLEPWVAIYILFPLSFLSLEWVITNLFNHFYYFSSLDRPMVLLIRWDLLHENRLYKYIQTVITLVTIVLVLVLNVINIFDEHDTPEMEFLKGLKPHMTPRPACDLQFEERTATPFSQAFSVFKTVLMVLIIGFIKRALSVARYDGPMAERHLRSIQEREAENKPLPQANISLWTVMNDPVSDILNSLVSTLYFVRYSAKEMAEFSEKRGLEHLDWDLLEGLSSKQIFDLKRFFFGFEDEQPSSWMYDGVSLFSKKYLFKCCTKKDEEDEEAAKARTKEYLESAGLISEMDEEELEETEKAIEVAEVSPDVEEMQEASGLKKTLSSIFNYPIRNRFAGLLWVMYLVFRRQLGILGLYLVFVPLQSYFSIGILSAIVLEGVFVFVIFLVLHWRDLDSSFTIVLNWELTREHLVVKWFSAIWLIGWFAFSLMGFSYVTFVEGFEKAFGSHLSAIAGCYFSSQGGFTLPPSYMSGVAQPKDGDSVLPYIKAWYYVSKVNDLLTLNPEDSYFVATIAFFVTAWGILSYNGPACLRYADQIRMLREEQQNQESGGCCGLCCSCKRSTPLPRIKFGLVKHITCDTERMLEETQVLSVLIMKPSDVDVCRDLSSFSTYNVSSFEELSQSDLTALRRFFFPYMFGEEGISPPYSREWVYETENPFCCICNCVRAKSGKGDD